MIVVQGTRSAPGLSAGMAVTPGEMATTVLGSWHATVLRWRRSAALLVDELALLPLALPLAPARTPPARGCSRTRRCAR
ncbi:hypothetical protein E9565_15430 [Blastococcus sp. KM273129]|nr:hypothetical protein [Blastococcus sp. KM273129]